MTFAVLANVLTMILCLAVLVQSVRMMRSLRTVKDGALTQVVQSLENATAQARAVLSDMKATLGGECAENARLVDVARGLRDELSTMVGFANAAADRVVDVVGMANALRAETTPVDAERDLETI
jgi:hypothetical protein